MDMDQALLGNIIELAISLPNSFEHFEVSVVQREANIVVHRVARNHSSLGAVSSVDVTGIIGGISTSSAADKVKSVLKHHFIYVFRRVKRMDSLKSPPPESQTMKKVLTIAIIVTTLFYLCCGGFKYAAFGNLHQGTP
ncbi:probable amino acid permease 7 [Quercus lobata]|uniref:probable amino acid permease 7 n=1 Tax=Quercus lobata TaxID=97700 RepID=UPI00124692DB|nr:probable amino acid permease 7 [Quercus lobata]